MRLAGRVSALEAIVPNPLERLSDDELRARIVDVVDELGGHGLELPEGWRASLAADPLGFMETIEPQLEAMRCEV